jgi:hypothetical protein
LLLEFIWKHRVSIAVLLGFGLFLFAAYAVDMDIAGVRWELQHIAGSYSTSMKCLSPSRRRCPWERRGAITSQRYVTAGAKFRAAHLE